MNTVDLFNTLRAHQAYKELLKFVIDELMAFDVDLRVVHVAGQYNQIADFLSRGLLTEAQRLRPLLQTQPYQPPAKLKEAVVS